MTAMKVLFISNGFPPQRWAGTETYTASIAKEFKKREYSVQVLCCGEWRKGADYWNGHEDDTYNGIPVRRLTVNWKNSPDPNKYLYANPVIGDYLNDYLKVDQTRSSSCYIL